MEGTATNLLDEPGVQMIVFNFRDITASKQAMAQLRQSEQRFRLLAEHAPDIIARFDRELRHLYVNPAIVKVTGIPAEVYIGKTNHASGNILVRLSEEEDAVTVAVQDFGIGISREHQVKIFERYYRAGNTTENTFPGLGMGLYISYEIVQQHGGCILVDSTTGKGSTFSFSLPVR